MTVFIVETYVVNPEKEKEFMSVLKKILDHKKKNPGRFKEMKSKKIFSQMFGDVTGKYIEMNEFDSLADAERYLARASKDQEFMKLYENAKLLLVPATYSETVWTSVM